ncbi:UNVERIFIED_CONTAM: hypothetical protein FKN15_069208 [Acipenser sinensis]
MGKTTILTSEYASIIISAQPIHYSLAVVFFPEGKFEKPVTQDLFQTTDIGRALKPTSYALREKEMTSARQQRVAAEKRTGRGSSVNLLTLDKVSPLHEACVGGNAACAKLLIEKGAKVNSATVDWNTPLFNACVSGNVACVNLLLQHGAKLQTEYHLSSPIHEAASRGHTECLEALLHHGADIDHNIKHLGTPLYVACTKQNVESVKKLLELGANLNTEGDTPLHAATRASRPDLVQLLLEHGADVKARNTEGKEPLDLATPGSEARRILMQREGLPVTQNRNERTDGMILSFAKSQRAIREFIAFRALPVTYTVIVRLMYSM